MNRRKAIWWLVAGSAGLGVAAGGSAWYRREKVPDLVYLDRSRALLAALAEGIIPSTDSPGAQEAGVAGFIIMMIRECTGRAEQNCFIDGLKELQSYSLRHYQASFESCSPQQQAEVLLHFEGKGRPMAGLMGKVQARYLGRSFFSILKDYTVEGYCTSEAGATRGLTYVAVPGSFHGCVPLQAGQRGWATN